MMGSRITRLAATGVVSLAALGATATMASANITPANTVITASTPAAGTAGNAQFTAGSFVVKCQSGAQFTTPATGNGPVSLTSIGGTGAPSFTGCTGGNVTSGTSPWTISVVAGSPNTVQFGVTAGTQVNIGTACRVSVNPITVTAPYTNGASTITIPATSVPFTRVSGVCPASPGTFSGTYTLSQPLTVN